VCGAAVRAAQAVNYEGAGTVEFIADASEGLRADRIWFMEMNTRLQVEHPVTEEITGQDLVLWQLIVASGHELPKTQEQLSIHGHAIEARLYAEDPAKGFLPSAGKLDLFRFDEDRVRIDSGFSEGDRITPFYDPMIAKLITHGPTRAKAIGNMVSAIDHSRIWPLKTNASFLLNAVGHPDFVTADLDTGFISRFEERLVSGEGPHPNLWRTAARAFVERFKSAPMAGFRLNAAPGCRVTLTHDGEVRMVDIALDEPFALAKAEWDGESLLLFMFGSGYRFDLSGRGGIVAGHGTHDGEIEAPMPGKVTAVEVAAGDKVAKGQRLLTLEAMKMEHALTAPFDGTVSELNATPGAQVTEGQILVKVEADE